MKTLSSYESSISYLKECEYRGEKPSNILRVHNAEMQEIEERIRSLQLCLRTVLDIYRAYEKDFHTREMGNLYETTPIYKTNGFKIGVGVAVVVGCSVLAVGAFPGVAIVTGAAVGSAIGAVSGGLIGGITAERNGGSFLDGFADGMLVGAIGGAISGAVGEATATAGLVVSVVANGVTDSAIYAGETAYRGGEITSRGLTVSFLTGAVLSGVTRIGVGKYTKAKGIESGRETVIYGSDDIANYQYNMIENPGPLAEVVDNPAKNFYGGRYNVNILEEDTIFYRAGQLDKPLGQWFTSEVPESVAKVRIDTAVKTQWIHQTTGELTGTSIVDTAYAIKIPKGTITYTGPIGPQGGASCGGYDKLQIFIETPWKIDGIEVIDSFSLK